MWKHRQFADIQLSCRAAVERVTPFQYTETDLAAAYTDIVAQHPAEMKVTCNGCGSEQGIAGARQVDINTF